MSVSERNSHQEIGTEQRLFFFHPYSPGSAFYWPDGALIFRRLQEFLRREYRLRGYQEVMSPQLFKEELWKQSGHWQKYRGNMFELKDEGLDETDKNKDEPAPAQDGEQSHYSLKAMNCPGHCLMFKQVTKSYRDLPLRYADFGCLHRNELSGSLRGLTRVRKFQQDDAHIFCTPDQIGAEITAFLEFLDEVYQRFGFEYTLELSTRPETYLGELEVWNQAEAALKQVLSTQSRKFQISEGDGAFYGPKIDVHLTDSAGRQHQCVIVQLDFVLPERFELEYAGEESGQLLRPVIIHRAVYGSFERFFAILCEHYDGKWPFWLSPHQIMLLPLGQDQMTYMKEVHNQLLKETDYQVATNMRMEQDLRSRIKEAELAQYHYIIVIGKKEVAEGKLCIRHKGKMKTMSISDFLNTI